MKIFEWILAHLVNYSDCLLFVIVIYFFKASLCVCMSKKGHTHCGGKIIVKYGKYIEDIKKSSSQEPQGQFQLNLAQSILW